MQKTERAAERATPKDIPNVLADTEINNPSLVRLQVSRLRRLYAVSLETASAIAILAYGVCR